jgi:hypothetical protein
MLPGEQGEKDGDRLSLLVPLSALFWSLKRSLREMRREIASLSAGILDRTRRPSEISP